jgi:hypothetical protein
MNRCKMLPALGQLWWGAARPLIAPETNAAVTLQQFRKRIAVHLAQPKFSGAFWGVKIIPPESGHNAYEEIDPIEVRLANFKGHSE